MDNKRKPRTNGDTAAKDNASAGLVINILGKHGRVIPDIHTNDSWPNTDGVVNVNDSSRTLLGLFSVQVKTLPKDHGKRFNCPVDLFIYVIETGDPIMLLMVDNDEDKVYWQYYDQDIVENLDYKDNQKTKTIELNDQYFDKEEQGYIVEWEKILKNKKTQSIKMRSALVELVNTEIGKSKDLIEKYCYSEAIDYLNDLKTRRWSTASDNEKFRIITNMALALQKLERFNEAAILFHEAFLLESSSSRAQINEAFALFIDDKPSVALEIIRKVLTDNPLDAIAASLVIHIMDKLNMDYRTIRESLDEIVLKTPEVLHAFASIIDGSIRNDEVINLLQQASDLDKDNLYISADLAIAKLYKVQQSKDGKINTHLTEENKCLAESALGLLKIFWAKISDPRDQKSKSNILYNLSVAYRILGDESNANATISELLRLDPANSLYLRHAVGNAIELGRYDLAESFLTKTAFSDTGTHELQLMFIDTLMMQNKNDEAFCLIERFLEGYTKKDELYLYANDNLFRSLINVGKLDDAQKLAEKLSLQFETKTLSLVFLAKLAQLQQKVERAIGLLVEAEVSIDGKTDRKIIYDLAEMALNLKSYDLAARAYERIVDIASDNIVTRHYLISLYNAKHYQSAIRIVGGLKSNGVIDEAVVQFEWMSYMALQDLPKAREALVEFIVNNPDDEEARISVALIDFRIQANRRLGSYLRRNIKLDKLSQQSLLQLAQLYSLKGNTEMTLRVAYEMRRRYPDSADAHSNYTTLILGLGNKKHSILDTKEVGADTVLIYEGGYFIVEAIYTPSLSNNEISLADAEKRGFVGKKKGEKIILSSNHLSGDKMTTLIDVQSKYIFALQDSMRNYERIFQGRTDLMSLDIGEDKNFSPLFKQLDKSNENANNAEDLYKTGKITIDLFSKLLGKNIIEVFYALRLSSQLGVRSARGDDAERLASQKVLSQTANPKLVVDITALITFYELKIKPQDVGLDKMLITQSTKDLIIAELSMIKAESKQKGSTLYKQGDKYIRQEITTKERKRRVENIQDLLKWVEFNVSVEPFTDDQLKSGIYNKASYKQVEDILLPSQLDTIKLSIGDRRILYSDDLVLKSLASEIFSVDSVATSTLLAYLSVSRKLNNITFTQNIIKLASANYYHIGISSVTIFQAAIDSGWKPDEPVIGVLRALGRPEVDMKSMVFVIINFLELSFNQGFIQEVKSLLSTILSEAVKSHDRSEVLSMLKTGISSAFKNSQAVKKMLLAIVDDWVEVNS